MSTESHRWHYDYTRILWDAGFTFNNHKSLKAFDRNGIALLDIERIIRDRDTGIVDYHIQNILEYSLDSEEARILDPNFVKLFRLSQLAVEYLNYCKRYLDVTTDTLKKELLRINEENDELKSDIISYELEISKLKKKVKDLKSTLHIHQKYQPTGTIRNQVGTFRCNECRKGFLNVEYLKKHFLKRHPDSGELQNLETKFEDPEADTEINSTPQYKAETDKLQMEIKELKEKLNNTERFFQNKTETVSNADKDEKESKAQSEEYYKHVEELHHQFELLKTQIESEMQLLKSQKSEQDKYEELMEKFFHKLDERKEKEIDTSQTTDTAQINEPSTSKTIEKVVEEKPVKTVEDVKIPEKELQQSEPDKNEEIIKHEEKETSITPKKSALQKPNENVSESPVQHEPVDVEKLKEEVEKDLEEKSKQNIEKLGKQISENIANTFDVLQSRLETFWNKLQEIEVDREKQQQIIVDKPPPREKQKIILTKPAPKIETNVRTNPEEIRMVQDAIKIHENINTAFQSSSDDYSDTESSRNEKVEIHKPQSVLKCVQKNDKIARNLIEELKTKVEERNLSMNVESRKPSPEKPKKSFVVEKPEKYVEKPKKHVEKPTVQQIYSNASKLETSTEESESELETESESESESETETPVAVKTSKTTTSFKSQKTTDGGKSSNTGIATLQDRSITSIEQALRSNPDILVKLRGDMKIIMASRLRDLGVDPEWSRIPDKTYKQNSEVVAHHRSIAAKNVKSFMEIRNYILENLEDEITDLKRRSSRDLTTPELEQKPSRFKNLLKNVRNKAKSIIKHERPRTPRSAPTVPIYKLTIHKQHSSSTPNIKQSPEKPKEILKSKSTGAKNSKIKQPESKSTMYDTDSDEIEINDYHQTTPTNINKNKSVQSSKKGLRKSRSESSMEVVEFSDQGPEIIKSTSVTNLARSVDSVLEMKRELANQLKLSEEKIYSASSSDNIDNSKDEVIAVTPKKGVDESGDKIFIMKSIETERSKMDISVSDVDSDDLKDDDKIQKGVLKNVAFTSVVKKKVLFDLHSENTRTSDTNEEQKPIETKERPPVKKTIVKPNSLFQTNDWNDSSTSIDSSILEIKKGPKQSVKGQGDTISTKAVINVSTKLNKAQDDISDWEISDIN